MTWTKQIKVPILILKTTKTKPNQKTTHKRDVQEYKKVLKASAFQWGEGAKKGSIGDTKAQKFPDVRIITNLY